MATILRDSSGQLWELSIGTDGALVQTPVSSGVPSDSAEATVTLQNVVDLCRTHVELMPLANVGGFSNEPALSLCNDTIQEMLSAPFNWKFNRAQPAPLMLQYGRQEYKFAGASAFTSKYGASIGLSANSAITESGTTVTVTTLQPHNFSVGDTVYMTGNDNDNYNSTYSQTPSASGWTNGWVITAVPSTTTFQFTHASSGLPASGASGLSDYGWLECGEMVDSQDISPAPYVWDLTAVRTMKLTGETGRPDKLCVHGIAGGVLTVRFNSVPTNTVWAVTLTYQKKAPLKTALTQTWSPFPDEFGFAYRQSFLARCYRFVSSPRADVEYQKAQATIVKALGRDDSEMSDQYVSPDFSLMGGSPWPWL